MRVRVLLAFFPVEAIYNLIKFCRFLNGSAAAGFGAKTKGL